MMRRRIATVLPLIMVASSVAVLTRPVLALAAGPSVPLPTVASTPVIQQNMTARAPNQDQASTDALHGDQKATTAADGGGTSKATPLSPSATWNVQAQSGDFTWSYPLRVPPSAGGLDPSLALSYNSAAVDGRTSATNNQASWIGDGWDLSTGFIERTYIPCVDDTMDGTTPPNNVGDLCWRSDNAVAAYSGGGGELIHDTASGGWRARSDDGSRIERLTGTANGDDDGESWRITSVDGTQYFFGSRPDASSTWTVPVFGDDAGDPCHKASFDTSSCTQAWRWNLDKVVDRNGNMILYNYDKETNTYGLNNKTTPVSYVRDGLLKSVEYGLRSDGSVPLATGRVDFTPADRCVPGSDCTPAKTANWPDVAWEDKCDTATCVKHPSPTFWSTKRLAKITTRVLSGSAYSDVDSWSLDQQFPLPGDGEKAVLWLKSITHTGLAGTPITLPPVTFEGTKMPNRVEKVDGLGPLLRYRLTGVVSETGGVITVTYAPPNCVDGSSMPASPETNTLRCFPQWWAKKDFTERMDYFHKYVVAQVTTSDRISANTEQVSAYEYLGGAAWRYDDSEFTKDSRRTWNRYGGFGQVRIRQGKADDPSGPITMTEQRFYRGMDGDHLPTGTRSVTVTDSAGGARKDSPWLRGFMYESQTHDGDADTVVAKMISTPTWQGPTATRGTANAYIVGTGSTVNYTALAAGGWRTTRQEQSYDERGVPVRTNDLGDTSTPADDKCTRTTYVRNTDRWLLTVPSETETVGVACDATPKFPDDAVAGTRNSYDGHAFGAVPDAANVTRVEDLDQRPASGAASYTVQTSATYDALGRVLTSSDAMNRVSKTSYVPSTGGPLTQTVETNALGQSTTTTLETAFGAAVQSRDANNQLTETAYDALGRVTEEWLPNHLRSAFARGNVRYEYLYRNDGPTVVSTTKIGPRGNYTTSNEIYDGLLRLRQTQTPAEGGGRLLTDTRYDSQGRAYKSTQPYFNDAAVDNGLWAGADAKLVEESDVNIAALTQTRFDGAGRKVAETFKGGTQGWQTTTAYGGDWVQQTPPAGGTPTMTISDAQGQVTELRQYHGTTPSGDYDSTTYTYTKAGQLATVTDPAGTVWRQTYDLHGRLVRDIDPDKGESTRTYNAAGQMATTTDARGTTLVYGYDALGRGSTVRADSDQGPLMAQWTYDTAVFGKGRPTTAIRYDDGNAYASTILGYDSVGHVLGSQTTVPSTGVDKELAGTYVTQSRYNVDGSQASQSYPAIGDLPTEVVNYDYDDLGKSTTSRGALGDQNVDYVTDTQYTHYGEPARIQLGDDGKRVWMSSYFDTNTRRVDRTIVDAELPQPMQTDTHYAYDPSGNITSIADTPAEQPADIQCFRTDYLQRITDAWTPAGSCTPDPSVAALAGPAPYWQSFSYDKVGNRQTETQHAAAGDTKRTYTYPAADQPHPHSLTAVATTGPSGNTTDGYGYDAGGNTVARNLAAGGQKLDWDAEGHLSKVTEGDQVTEFLYDPDGGRLIRRDPTGSTLYLDGQELRLTKANGALTATRYYAEGGVGTAMRDRTGLTWLAGDHQGTAQVAINSSTLQVARRRQTPFGAPRGAAVAFPGEKGFVGGTTDSSTGLTHLGAREYDPDTGRFISVDPVMTLADPQQMQGYTYANNNPITKSDPSGALWGSLWGAIQKEATRAGDFLHLVGAAYDGVQAAEREGEADMWRGLVDLNGKAGQALLDANAAAGQALIDSFKGDVAWVRRNKGWIGTAAGLFALLTPVGWVGAGALVVGGSISIGMTGWDMIELGTKPNRTPDEDLALALDGFSMGSGILGSTYKLGSAGTRAAFGDRAMGTVGSGIDVGGATGLIDSPTRTVSATRTLPPALSFKLPDIFCHGPITATSPGYCGSSLEFPHNDYHGFVLPKDYFAAYRTGGAAAPRKSTAPTPYRPPPAARPAPPNYHDVGGGTYCPSGRSGPCMS